MAPSSLIAFVAWAYSGRSDAMTRTQAANHGRTSGPLHNSGTAVLFTGRAPQRAVEQR